MLKFKDAKELFREKVLDEVEVDLVRLITIEEFKRNRVFADDKRDYRERVVERALDMKVPFSTDWNIGRTLRKKIIRVKCPYCGGPMDSRFGGGAGNTEHDDYTCINQACGAKVTLAYPLPGAVGVTPPLSIKDAL